MVVIAVALVQGGGGGGEGGNAFIVLVGEAAEAVHGGCLALACVEGRFCFEGAMCGLSSTTSRRKHRLSSFQNIYPTIKHTSFGTCFFSSKTFKSLHKTKSACPLIIFQL